MLIKDGYVYDNMLPQPVRAEEYEGVIVGGIYLADTPPLKSVVFE